LVEIQPSPSSIPETKNMNQQQNYGGAAGGNGNPSTRRPKGMSPEDKKTRDDEEKMREEIKKLQEQLHPIRRKK
jgi:hypothetical protein